MRSRSDNQLSHEMQQANQKQLPQIANNLRPHANFKYDRLLKSCLKRPDLDESSPQAMFAQMIQAQNNTSDDNGSL